MKVPVKICGLKRPEDIRLCQSLGVTIAGLVTEYPLPVPWNLTAKEASLLIREIASPLKSCIVTGGTAKQILSLAKELHPDYVQLHFHETLADTAFLVKELKPLHIGIIKTLPVDRKERLKQFEMSSPTSCAKELERSGVSAILIDSRTPDNAGTKGSLPDFAFYKSIQAAVNLPVILAGGITPDNISQILPEVKPDVIDIMTGVENLPGVKSKKLLTQLLQQIY